MIENTAKPRRKKKSIILTMRYTLDIHEDDDQQANNIGKLFTCWMRDKFACWDDAILQRFLFENNIVQNKDDDRLELDGTLEKIVRNDCMPEEERKEFENTLNNDIDYDLDQEYDEDMTFDFNLIKDTSSSEGHKNEEIPTKGEPGFEEYYKRK